MTLLAASLEQAVDCMVADGRPMFTAWWSHNLACVAATCAQKVPHASIRTEPGCQGPELWFSALVVLIGFHP
jgi:hypothetical protein